jgi:hypothetical protein
MKCGDGHGSSYSRGYLILYVSYDWSEKDCEFKIKRVSSGGDISLTPDNPKLTNIISKYFLLTKMESKKVESARVNKKLNEVIKIIGKDTVRDNRIDELLKDL